MAKLRVIQELCQRFRQSVTAFLENVLYLLADPFVKQVVKNREARSFYRYRN